MSQINETYPVSHHLIHVQWEGPFPFASVSSWNRPTDYGVYQVYGRHPLYGANALLYLGRAQQTTFAKRLSQEGWENWQAAEGPVQVHLGRLSGSATPDALAWDEQIACVERLLIFAHRPAHNASGLYRNNDPDLEHLHVFNWGARGDLLPEVSGQRMIQRFAVIPGYAPYGSHQEPEQPKETE
jgi:hypothetical protein